MILIADSGSTKTSWLLTDGKKVVNTLTTIGYNPYYFNNNSIVNSMKSELIPILSGNMIDKIFFYGSGCSSDENCSMVKNTLLELFPNSIIEVNHDLFGAAVALLKNSEGIACILGTGSNSCHWDGKQIVQNVPSVGYLLGDEGSGTYIGMKILKGILEERAPVNIINSFYNYYNTSFEGVLNSIYNKPKPNSFISTIGIFAANNISNSWISNSIKQSFTDFIDNQIKQYDNYQNLNVSFTGSIAYHFKEILLDACNNNGITPGIIIKNPIEGLFTYHINKLNK
jgi:N-acetylglucosamine kinase-like BadF-type ATPase